MIKLIRLLMLHGVLILVPILSIYLIFQVPISYVLMGLWITIYAFIYSTADKYLLMILGAREIIDADSKSIYQILKSACFRNFENMPKVYVYTGHGDRCFVWVSKNNWSVVIDRNILDRTNEEFLTKLIQLLIDFKKRSDIDVVTKGVGIMALGLKLNYWVLEKISLKKRETYFYKILCFISLIFLKPLIELILMICHNNVAIKLNDDLKAYLVDTEKLSTVNNFSEFMTLHLAENVSINQLLVEYIESFSVFHQVINANKKV